GKRGAMNEDYQQMKKPLWLRIYLSPDEPRLRAGWRLLLHSIGFGFMLSILALLAVVLAFNRGGQLSYGLPLDATIELLAVLVATYLARRFLDRRSFASLGFRIDQHTLPDLLVGFMIPALLIAGIFLVEWGLGWLKFDSVAWQSMSFSGWIGILLQGLLLFVIVGVSEEVLSRGYHLQNLTDGLNLFWGLLISSSIFAILHLLNPDTSLFSSLGILAAGYFLAYGWVRTRQLWLSIGLHIGWNLFEGTVFGFPVSGYKINALIQQTSSGPDLITGGGFGPEAGLILLPALLLGALLIRYYTRGRTAESADTPPD
ncbi:MAG: type II CAAX endopeptidase family protein, partial [Anaerolineales bacterium]